MLSRINYFHFCFFGDKVTRSRTELRRISFSISCLKPFFEFFKNSSYHILRFQLQSAVSFTSLKEFSLIIRITEDNVYSIYSCSMLYLLLSKSKNINIFLRFCKIYVFLFLSFLSLSCFCLPFKRSTDMKQFNGISVDKRRSLIHYGITYSALWMRGRRVI